MGTGLPLHCRKVSPGTQLRACEVESPKHRNTAAPRDLPTHHSSGLWVGVAGSTGLQRSKSGEREAGNWIKKNIREVPSWRSGNESD